jgi:hypothetical protein
MEEQRRQWEEEYQKNLEALDRVARLIPSGSAPSQVNGAQVAIKALFTSKDQSTEEEERSSDSDTPSLISAVLETVLSRPNASLSPRLVLEILESQNFPFTRDNGKRILSVAQALRKLTERDQPQVRIARRGSGRRPNLYRALMQEINPAHVTNAARSSERSM